MNSNSEREIRNWKKAMGEEGVERVRRREKVCLGKRESTCRNRKERVTCNYYFIHVIYSFPFFSLGIAHTHTPVFLKFVCHSHAFS